MTCLVICYGIFENVKYETITPLLKTWWFIVSLAHLLE